MRLTLHRRPQTPSAAPHPEAPNHEPSGNLASHKRQNPPETLSVAQKQEFIHVLKEQYMSTNRTTPEQDPPVLHGPLKQALFLDSIEDYSSVSRMADWPGCPDLRTYREAFIARMAVLDQVAPALASNANTIYEGSEDFRVGLMQEQSALNAAAELQLLFGMSREQIAHGEICHDRHQTSRYSRWALQTWNQYRGQPDEQEIKLLLALEGESPTTIGAWIESNSMVRPPTQSAITFTRLARNLDWMGLDEALPHVRDCTCVMFQSAENWPHPSHFIAMTGEIPEFFPEQHPGNHVPVSDQQEMLRAILEYHGARETLWLEADHHNPPPASQYQFARAKLRHLTDAAQLDGSTSWQSALGRLIRTRLKQSADQATVRRYRSSAAS